jgi:hypothetical protein
MKMKTTSRQSYYVQRVIEFLNRKDLKGNAQKFHREFKADIEAAMRLPRNAGLQKLEDRINEAKLERVLMIDPLDKAPIRGMPGELVMDFGDEKFIFQEHVGGQGFKKVLYWHLYWTLWQGEFVMLKKCRQCSQFFASYRRDAQACSPKCNSEYHNAKYQREDKFMKAYFMRKKNKLKEAEKLRDSGKSRLEIIKQTRLTELALIRAEILAPR